jgi:hypothetical protein
MPRTWWLGAEGGLPDLLGEQLRMMQDTIGYGPTGETGQNRPSLWSSVDHLIL